MKKVFSDMEKGSGTLDVSSRRDEFIGRAISLLELTSEVPEAFSVTLKILVFHAFPTIECLMRVVF